MDTESFASGIRNAMRQDPEVIFIGEIRDRGSIQAAMQAAKTGHLVLATLHADSISQIESHGFAPAMPGILKPDPESWSGFGNLPKLPVPGLESRL